MNGTIRDWKLCARQALSGKYGTAVLGMVAVTGITFLGSMLTSVFFEVSTLTQLVISQAFLFVFTLIMAVFTAGLSHMYLNMARRKPFSMGDLLYLFRNNPDRVIVAAAVPSLIEVLTVVPYYYYVFTAKSPVTVEEQMAALETELMFQLGSIVLGFLLTMPFTLIYYLVADNPEMSGAEALKASVRLMRGHLWKYFLLQLSFVPLMLLSVFTLYIGLLWLVPYMQMADVMFYLDVKGELILHVSSGYPGEDFSARSDYPDRKGEYNSRNTEIGAQEGRTGDDYNSEA